MKKTTILFLAFLVLVVAISGCVGKQAAQTNTPQTGNTQTTGGVSGEIPAANSGGLTVETPQASAGENVDLGSLI